MKLKLTKFKDLFVIEHDVYRDERGYFLETYSKQFINKEFVQDNVSFSKQGTLRGLHFQKTPFQQGKLVRVLKGKVYDVAVDLRRDSKTYKQWYFEILSDENNLSMYIPEGFAHGFQVLSKDAIFQYKCTNFFKPEYGQGIKWDDKTLNIEWPMTPTFISEKDKNSPTFDYVEELI